MQFILAISLSAMVLPTAGASFLWGTRAAWIVAAVSSLAGFVISLWTKVPLAEMAGPWAALGLTPLLAWAGGWQTQEAAAELSRREKLLRDEVRNLQEKRHAHLQIIRAREEAIHQIAESYEVSKQFLATLELEEILGTIAEVLAKEFPQLAESQRREMLQSLRSLVEEGALSREDLLARVKLFNHPQEVERRWEQVAGQLFLGLRRVSLYAQVQALASHDGLTGLFTRRHFQERLKEEVGRSLRRESSLAFLMVDLDHFKKVNDTCGHLVGDVVLREVSHLIRKSVREIDLVGRFGGEEFAVALPQMNRDDALGVAQRIRMLIEETQIPAYDERVSVTVSIGVAMCPGDAQTIEQLIEMADAAMYQAKSAGRNKVIAA